MRNVKIVATIGPASDSDAALEALIRAGMNVARLNFSHGTHDQHRARVTRIREASKRLNVPVGILQDLQGPKIRVGKLDVPLQLSVNEEIVLYAAQDAPPKNGTQAIPVDFRELFDSVQKGDKLLLDDGRLALAVVSVNGRVVQAKVLVGGALSSHKGINLPGVKLRIAGFTDKDKADLAFGISQNVDAVAISFVRSVADVMTVREAISELSAGQREPMLIAKLEKPEALDELYDILDVVDGVMVARGDLGIELPVEKVPLIQKRIIREARHALKPVIVATQMLESMIEKPTPTRAEVSDIANAIEDGCDAVMLSAETASGQYPVAAVRVMQSVARDVETNYADSAASSHFLEETTGEPMRKAMVMGAAMIAEALKAKYIVVRSESGETARYLSKIRGRCPIIAVHPDDAVLRRHALFWGVLPLRTDADQSGLPSMDAELKYLASAILVQGLVEPQDSIIVVSRYPWGEQQPPNSIRTMIVGEVAGTTGG